MANLDLDLNLLKILEALFTHRNVSAAAQSLGLSQPGVSVALKRLRVHFGDELFIRQRGQMVPTATAERLRDTVLRIMSSIQSELVPAGSFDPERSDRCFAIGLSDLGELTFLPDLSAVLRERAPRVTVRSVSLPPRDLRMAMTDGAIDLAIGYFMEFDGENFFSQKLFEQTFVCLARTDHPVTGNVITLEQFAQADHAVVEQEGRSQEVFERHLASLGIERRIVLRSPHFMSVPLLIARSDVIATVPLAVARIYTQIIGLKMLALPFRSPSVDLKQFWHRRSHGDPGTIWLRRLVAELFIGTDPTAGGRSPFWRSFAEALPNASRHGG